MTAPPWLWLPVTVFAVLGMWCWLLAVTNHLTHPENYGVRDEEFRAGKRAISQERRAQHQVHRIARQRERICFWTWPWGHRWRHDGKHSYVCRVCDKTRDDCELQG